MNCQNHHTHPTYFKAKQCSSHPSQIIETLKLIDNLQHACPKDRPHLPCIRADKPFLGNISYANTRPVVIYLKNGCPFQVIDIENESFDEPCIFRVEEVCKDVVTLRLLTPTFDNHSPFNCASNDQTYLPTHTCVMLDINQIGAIQCLKDTYIPLKHC